MLHIIYGRGGVGKTESLLEFLRSYSGTSPALLIVPETASHMAERRLAETVGDRASLLCEVVTFRRLAQRIFTVAGGLADHAPDDGSRILLMYDAFQRVRHTARVYTNLTRSCKLLEDLLTLYDECAAGCAEPEKLVEAAGQCPGLLHDKLSDLALLYSSYNTRARAILTDPRDQLERAHDLAVQCGFFRDKTVLLDGFEGFTPREWELLNVILAQCADLYAAFTGDNLGADDDSVFYKPMHTCDILTRAAESHGHTVSRTLLSVPENRPGDAAYLEANFEDYSASSYTGNAGIVQLHIAPSPHEEYLAVAAEILRLTREGGLRYRDCAVVMPSESGMQTLTELISRCGIPYFLSEKTDLLSTSVCAMAVYGLEAAAGGLESEDVLAYLKTGMTTVSRADVDILENYIHTRRIRSLSPEAPWVGHPDGLTAEFDDDSRARLDRLNEIRTAVREPLMRLRRAILGKTPALDKARALYGFLEDTGMPLICAKRAEECERAGDRSGADLFRQLWDILCQALDSFAQVLGDTEIELAEFTSLFRLTLTQYSAGIIPSSLDRVHVGTLETLQTHTAKAVFVVGLTDDAYPGISAGTGLLTDAERDRLDAMGLELSLTAEGRERARRFAFYTTMYTPDTLLWYSYPLSDLSGGQTRPSTAFSRISALLPQNPVTTADAHAASLEAPSAALEYALSRTNQEAREAFAWFEGQSAYAPFIRRYASETPRGPIESPAVRNALYGGRPKLSASSVDRFFDCQYRFFIQNGLKLDERRPAEFDAPELGTFLHYVLQHTIEDVHHRYAAWADAEKERVLAIGRAYADKYIEEKLSAALDGNARFARQLARVRRALDTLLANLYDEFSVCLFEPLDFELSFSAHDELGSIHIPLGEGRWAELSGRVDRVDGFLHNGKLYIRVVDYKSAAKAFSFTDIAQGMNMQLPLYLFVLQERADRYARLHPEIGTAAPIVPAGIMYVPIGSPFAASERPPCDSEDIRALHSEKEERTGLFLADKSVLQAMNPKAGGSFIPVSFKNDGSFKAGSPVAEPEEFAALGKHVKKMLAVMGHKLISGANEANPRIISGDRTSCTFCPYREVCRFDSATESYRRFDRLTQKDFFAAIEKPDERGSEQ